MKKQLLKICALLLLLVTISSSALAQHTINSVVLRYDDAGGEEILLNSPIVLGSTIYYDINYTVETEGVINMMQRAYYGDGTENPKWPLVSPGSIATVVGTNSITGTFELNDASNMIASESGIIKFALVSGTTKDFWQLSVEFTKGEPNPDTPVISSASYTNQGTLALGSSFTFDVDFSVPDNGKVYQLGVMQTCWLEGGSEAVWVNTTKYPIDASGSSFNGLFNVVMENNGGVSCIAGVGNISFVLFEDDVIMESTRQQIQTEFTKTATNIAIGLSDEFKIYPNPATTDLFVQAESGALIEICNVTGAVIKTQISSSELQYISISDLDRGMYIIKVKGDDSSFTSKLLVK